MFDHGDCILNSLLVIVRRRPRPTPSNISPKQNLKYNHHGQRGFLPYDERPRSLLNTERQQDPYTKTTRQAICVTNPSCPLEGRSQNHCSHCLHSHSFISWHYTPFPTLPSKLADQSRARATSSTYSKLNFHIATSYCQPSRSVLSR